MVFNFFIKMIISWSLNIYIGQLKTSFKMEHQAFSFHVIWLAIKNFIKCICFHFKWTDLSKTTAKLSSFIIPSNIPTSSFSYIYYFRVLFLRMEYTAYIYNK
jgi:hypothetical protein